MKPTTRNTLIFLIGFAFGTVGLLSTPLGLPDWTSAVGIWLFAASLWMVKWLHKRDKLRGVVTYAPNTFFKTKSGRVALLLLSTVVAIGSIYVFAQLVRQTHVRFIDQDLGAAWTESQKLPEGFVRGEDYLRRLKSIKTAYAPAEMKQALFDYIAAYEKGLIAMEAGRDAPEQSKAMAEAKERMLAAELKYQ
jgi:Xaa-Pro aminopeptidase